MAEKLNWLDEISILSLTLQVITKYKDKFIGEVFFYNPKTNILILSKLSLLTDFNIYEEQKLIGSKKFNFIYLNANYLQEIRIIKIKNINVCNFYNFIL